MNDYANYFIERNAPEKRGVSIHRDIDWWMSFLTKKMAKLLFLALCGVLFLFLKSLYHVGHNQQKFPIKNITLTGDVLITQPKDIENIASTINKPSVLSVNINELSDKINALPWIDKATITRHWPSRLNIDLIERKAAYRWGNSELIDESGHRFANIDNSIFVDLPKIYGVDGHENQVISAYQKLISDLGVANKTLRIKKFVLNQYLSWELHIESGVVIKFGRGNFDERLARFVRAYQSQKLPHFKKVAVLDFRYNRGFAVKWKPEFMPHARAKNLLKVSHSTRI